MGNNTGLATLNLLTVREIRDIFGVSRSTVYRWIDQEKFSKVGKVNGLEDYQRQKVLLLEPLDESLIQDIQAWIKKRARSKKPLFLAQKLARNTIDQIPIEPIDEDHHDEKKLSKEIQALLAELSEEREARNRFLQELEMAAQDLKTDAGLSEEAQLTKILTSLDSIRQSELELLREAEHSIADPTTSPEISAKGEAAPAGVSMVPEEGKEPLKPAAEDESIEETITVSETEEIQDSVELEGAEIGEEGLESQTPEATEETQLPPKESLPPSQKTGEGILEVAEGDEDLLTIEMSAEDLPAWLENPEQQKDLDQGISPEEEEDLEESFLGNHEEDPESFAPEPTTFSPEEEEIADSAADPEDPDADEIPEASLDQGEIQEDLATSFLGQEEAKPQAEKGGKAEESARSLAMLFGISPDSVAPPPKEPEPFPDHLEVKPPETPKPAGDDQLEENPEKPEDPKKFEENEPSTSLPQPQQSQVNNLATLFSLDPKTGQPRAEDSAPTTTPPQPQTSDQGIPQEEAQSDNIAMVFDAPPRKDPEENSQEKSGEKVEPQSDDSIAMVFGAPPPKEEEVKQEEAQDDSIAMVFDAPPSPSPQEKESQNPKEESLPKANPEEAEDLSATPNAVPTVSALKEGIPEGGGLAEIRGPVTEIAQHTKEVAASLNRLTETAQGAAQEFSKRLDANNSTGKTLVTLGLFALALCWFLAMVLKPFLGEAGFYLLLAANVAASITVLLGRKKIIESASTPEE